MSKGSTSSTAKPGIARGQTCYCSTAFPARATCSETSSHALADPCHAIAPDLPGFGRTAMPSREEFGYTFDNIARIMGRFTELVGLDRFAPLCF